MKRLTIILVFASLVFTAEAQIGDISGKVKDQNDWGIKASVAIVDTAGKTIGVVTKTDKDGNYSLAPLAPGKYNLMFSAQGYSSVLNSGIIVSADKSTFVDVRMKVDPNATVGKRKKK